VVPANATIRAARDRPMSVEMGSVGGATPSLLSWVEAGEGWGDGSTAQPLGGVI